MPAAPSVEDLSRELADLNERIKAVNVNWPTGAVVAAYAGGVMLYVTLLLGIVLVASSVVPLLVVVGMALGGIGLVVAGVIVGNTTAADARALREALIKERDELKRQLERDPAAPVPFVELARPVAPLVVARF